MKYHLKWVVTTGIILLLILVTSQSNGLLTSASEKKDATNHLLTETNLQSPKAHKGKEATISHDQIVALTEKFMDILVQQIDNDYKVINYDTKRDLLNAFKKITQENVAKEYVDFYYHEEVDGLYIVPTETPAWFNKENDYDVVQLNNHKVNIIQKNQSDMYGDYVVEFEFTFDKEWKITKIKHS